MGAAHHPLPSQNNQTTVSLQHGRPRQHCPHIASTAAAADTLPVQLVHNLLAPLPEDDNKAPAPLSTVLGADASLADAVAAAIAMRCPMSLDMTDDRFTCIPQSMASNTPPPSQGDPP